MIVGVARTFPILIEHAVDEDPSDDDYEQTDPGLGDGQIVEVDGVDQAMVLHDNDNPQRTGYQSVAWTDSGRAVAVVAGKAVTWTKGGTPHPLPVHGTVESIDVSRDGKRLVWNETSDGKRRVVVGTSTGKPLQTLDVDADDVRFGVDGRTLYFTTEKQLRAYDMRSGQVTAVADDVVNAPAISPDGKAIAILQYTANDVALRIVDSHTHAVRTIDEHMEEEMNVSWSPDGSRLLVVEPCFDVDSEVGSDLFIFDAHASDNPMLQHAQFECHIARIVPQYERRRG